MKKAVIANGCLVYKSFLKNVELPLDAIVWGYLQLEEVKASMCCGGFRTEIGRVIFVERSGKQHIIAYEDAEMAKELLNAVKTANAQMAVGYTEENKAKFYREGHNAK